LFIIPCINKEIGDKMSEIKKFDVIIIGAGPAGLTAGIYLARAGKKALVLGDPYESQVAKLELIENYPGFEKGVQGLELMESMQKQTKANGAKVINNLVAKIEKDDNGFRVTSDEDEVFFAYAIILAMGSRYRKIRVKGEEEYFTKGVSYCAVCDGALYREKPTAVIGYGTGAAQAAVYLSNISSEVHLLCNRSEIGAEAIDEYRLKEKTKENVNILYNARVLEIAGDEFVNKIIYKKDGIESEIPVEAAFIEYGSIPNTVLADQLGVEIDEKGFIKTNNVNMETNIHGVFAAGDVRGNVRQIATAIGDGCTAAYSAQDYLQELEKE
jgi:thioredoxin reductase (NADPH)